jgi:hypothetical protein
MFERIPAEMRMYPQWVCWRFEESDTGKPTKVPYSAMNGAHANVNDPSTWTTYEQALHALQTTGWYSGIGFVLTEDDPYVFIDLDDPWAVEPSGRPKHTDPNHIYEMQKEVFAQSNSYAELSPSGKGVHIIGRASIPSGRKRGSMEIYSSQRFMTMTGNVLRDAPICDETLLSEQLWQRMGVGTTASASFAGLEHAKHTNEEVLTIAINAANGEKFKDLFYDGNWQKYYESQSEADFALVDILAFYSENRAQVKEMFLASKLGQRTKSQRADYIGYMLNRCFDRMLPPVDIEGLRDELQAAMNSKRVLIQSINVTPVPHLAATPPPPLPAPSQSVYSAPPGLVGEIAQFIYAAAARPVPEIALAGAIGLMAGIVGRSYNISGTGLNQMVLLLADTGTGKESIAGGIDKLMAAVVRTVPAALDFIGPGKISSEQALIKYMSKTANSFVSTVGEFGIQLKLMASPYAAPHMQGLMSMILDLYNKSGEGKVLRPSIYSDREKNTASVLSPAFSLIGESTPEKFYESLDESMISSGLLPRFTTIEYRGKRPELNKSHILALPSFELVEKLATVCANSLQLNSQHKAIHVQMAPDAQNIMDQFDKHCDTNINSSDREVRRHLWNRAHIKALKLSALIAVGVNPYDPVVTLDVAQWAIELVVADVRNLLHRFDAGEIGVDNDETKQIAKVMETIKDYVTKPWADVQKYSTSPPSMHGDNVVPFSYLSRRLAAVSVFRKDKAGASKAIERAVKTVLDRGDIQELSRGDLTKKYGTYAKAYMISSMKAFGL